MWAGTDQVAQRRVGRLGQFVDEPLQRQRPLGVALRFARLDEQSVKLKKKQSYETTVSTKIFKATLWKCSENVKKSEKFSRVKTRSNRSEAE